ncbi:DUF1206 domain-containing protein [Aurantimonas sp. VKM B-3413]|uniref:DUF1206 domain-containing protein n=1 Tax=Aurantimonas sp. VKM B-3413 TaxID=2779401 RepID=UPI001E46B674|nr:DUF1206 domain-containing protein [Aurantimonas sp. VKM B-3413]MCB8837429.1 DUF1206 domain-containing protein [Aurantimonas sp. VKM B-3413]
MANADETPGWVDPVMRAGYSARGAVHLLVGIFAFAAAWYGSGNGEGTKGALKSLLGGWLGVTMLALIALGLAAYAAWRAIDGWMDLEDHGHGFKGIVARGALFVTALINLGLGIYAASLIFTAGFSLSGSSSGGSGGSSGPKGFTAWVMSYPFGQWIVVAAGVAILGAGGYFFVKAYTGKYKSHLRSTKTSERLDPLAKLGLVAEGIVIAIIGCFFIYAGWTHDASQAGGIGAALQTVREQAYGRILLGAVGIGLVFYCVYCLIEAVYRVIPRLAGDDTITIADRLQNQAQNEVRQAVN